MSMFTIYLFCLCLRAWLNVCLRQCAFCLLFLVCRLFFFLRCEFICIGMSVGICVSLCVNVCKYVHVNVYVNGYVYVHVHLDLDVDVSL